MPTVSSLRRVKSAGVETSGLCQSYEPYWLLCMGSLPSQRTPP